jgi:hypothetical protein
MNLFVTFVTANATVTGLFTMRTRPALTVSLESSKDTIATCWSTACVWRRDAGHPTVLVGSEHAIKTTAVSVSFRTACLRGKNGNLNTADSTPVDGRGDHAKRHGRYRAISKII